jgi:hypothetical protein
VNARRSLSIICLSIAALSLPHRAAAQGNSQNHGRAARPPAKTPAAPAPALPAGTGVRNFGAWLDDSSIVDPHTGWAGFSLGYWKSPLGRQIDMPSSDIGYGLSRSVQVGFTMPYYRSRFGTDAASGLGDVYLNAKVNLVDATRNARHAGVAVIPVVEILSGLPDGSNRWHWGIPVSAEMQLGPARVYGAGGYFSRGALFGSGAVEWTSARNYTVTGSLTRSYSLADDPLSDALGLNRNRLDASGSVSRAIAKSVAIYGGIGRTLSRADANSTRISINGGIVTFFNGPAQTPARRKRR